MGDWLMGSPQESHTQSMSNIGPEQSSLVYALSQYFGGQQLGSKPAEYNQLAGILGNSDANLKSQASDYYNNALLGPSMKAFNEVTKPAISSAFASYGGTLNSKRGQAIAKGASDVQANAQSGLAQILPQLFQANTQRMGTQIQGYQSLYNLGQAPTNQVQQFALSPTYNGGGRSMGQSTGVAGAAGALASLLALL